jgi:hypothetical protein
LSREQGRVCVVKFLHHKGGQECLAIQEENNWNSVYKEWFEEMFPDRLFVMKCSLGARVLLNLLFFRVPTGQTTITYATLRTDTQSACSWSDSSFLLTRGNPQGFEMASCWCRAKIWSNIVCCFAGFGGRRRGSLRRHYQAHYVGAGKLQYACASNGQSHQRRRRQIAPRIGPQSRICRSCLVSGKRQHSCNVGVTSTLASGVAAATRLLLILVR